jgi:hypothetical protein
MLSVAIGGDVPKRIQEAEIVNGATVANCIHADSGLLELSTIRFTLIS